MELSKQKCIPCEGNVPQLPKTRAKQLVRLVDGWVMHGKVIEKGYNFQDFKTAKEFIDKVAVVAEKEGHHPDILWYYNKIRLTLWTHAANGLTENDFIMAAKIDHII